MKMKILAVAVFCAYFVTAFSKEFNGTMSNQLTGKSLPPSIVHDSATTRKLSTVLITADKGPTLTLGVLLSRERVAFPEMYWSENTGLRAHVSCFFTKGQPLPSCEVFLKNRVPEETRHYSAEGIVEVELANEVPDDCWPPREERYTVCATENEMQSGKPVFAMIRNTQDTDTLQKSYIFSDVEMHKYVKIKSRNDISYAVTNFFPGVPLFYDKKIAGMYVPGISENEGMFTALLRFIMFRSLGESSNQMTCSIESW